MAGCGFGNRDEAQPLTKMSTISQAVPLLAPSRNAVGKPAVGLAERMALPPGAPLYRVSPEYVRWRIRQGEETSRQAGRRVAPEYLTWRHLLDGIDDTWHPDLQALPPPGDPWRPWGRGALLLPQAAGTDGMFVLRLRAPV